MNEIINRCRWVNMKNPLYIQYHDTEWGIPQHADQMLFELLILEGFQAGLSWECVLNKRVRFRQVYDNFDVEKVSRYDEKKMQELLADPGIIRNRLKVQASVRNARVFLQIQAEFGSFDAYLWGFTDGKTIDESYDLRTTSPLSDQISKDLKKRGMKFAGSTVIYSYLQAVGVINAHGVECDAVEAVCRGRPACFLTGGALGPGELCRQLAEAGIPVTDRREEDVDCLLIGFDTELTFRKLEDACILLNRGVDFIAANPDWVCPTWYGAVPDCGSVCEMLRRATGRGVRMGHFWMRERVCSFPSSSVSFTRGASML